MAGSPKARRRIAGRKRGNNHIPAELSIARETRAWELKVRGHSTVDIVAALKAEFGGSITARAVQKAIARVAERTLAEAEKYATQYKGREIGSLLAIYEEAMAAWRRTIGVQVDTTTREEQEPPAAAAPVAPPTEAGGRAPEAHAAAMVGPPALLPKRTVTRSEKTLPGDPRFLEKALEARRDLRKLLGIDAPIAIDLPKDRPLEKLSDAEIEALALAGAASLAQGR